jgi:hypothetical protein
LKNPKIVANWLSAGTRAVEDDSDDHKQIDVDFFRYI